MNKIKNSFKNIITVLMALLLLGLTAGTASAAVDVSVSPSSAIGGTVQSLNITITDNINNTAFYNITLPGFTLPADFGISGSNFSNLSTNALNFSQGIANLTVSNGATGTSTAYVNFSSNLTGNQSVSGTAFFINISNLTVPAVTNTSDVATAITVLTNGSTGTATFTRTVSSVNATTTLTNISIFKVANNSDIFQLLVTAKDVYGNNVSGVTFTASSNRTANDTATVSGATNATGNAFVNVTSTLAGQANITVTSGTESKSDTNVVFVAGPANKLVFFGPNSAAGTTATTPGTTTQTIAVQDVYGNNVTGGIPATLITLTKSGSATFPSGNTLTITDASISSNNSVLGINTTGVFSSSFVVNDTVVETTTIGASPNATFSAISKNIQFFGPVSKLAVTLSKSTLYANNSDTLVATAQLQDAANNNITTSGISVTLTANNASLLTIASPTNTTDANGATTFTVTAKAIAASTFLTAIDTGGNNGNSPTVTLNQAPNLTSSVVVNSTSGVILTGANSTITATIKDYNGAGVAISGKDVTFNITTGDATFTDGTTLKTVATVSNGNASAVITSTNASTTISVNVTILDENGVKRQVDSLQNFTVTPSAASQFAITPSKNVGLKNVPGTLQQFTIQTKDSVGNVNNTASGTINITTDNQALGNMSNATATGVLNNLTVTITSGVATFNYTVNSSTEGKAVLTLNSSLGIVDTITITTSGAKGISLTVNKTVQQVGSEVLASAQLTDVAGNVLGISGTNISFAVKNAANVIQNVGTNATNGSGIAIFNFTQSVAGVYTVTASNATLVLSNSTTVTFAGPPASVMVVANKTSPQVDETISINATVKDANGVTSGALDGQTMEFLADSSQFASAPITNGVATKTYTRATAGTVTITAFYNASLQGSTSVTFGAAPTLNVVASPTTVTVGTPTSVTFTVTSAGTAVSGAAVTLSGNATGSNTTDASGIAIISVNATGAGTITATASKSGYTGGSTSITASAAFPAALVSAVTPNSRVAQVGIPVTVFMSVINYGGTTANGVSITQASSLPVTVGYQQWNGTALIGSPNTPVNIAAGGTVHFVLTINDTAAFSTSSLTFNVSGTNVAAAPISGVNTLTISASTVPYADVIMISTTLDVRTGVNTPTAFAVATTNVGANATGVSFVLSVPASITGLAYQVNETYPANGTIKGPATGLTINSGAQPTFAVFLTPTQPIARDLVNNRITLQLVDGTGKVIGAQSVAVSTT